MRFPNTEKFFVEELSLDEGNYRFRRAEDQKACIEKIYNQNPSYFKTLMESLGQDDLAQPLIVYQEKDGNNIVMDGNRRLAALKVLYDADKYYPASNLIGRAKELKGLGKVDFENILAMCSNDKSLIDKTIYDIHAAGGGITQIGWNAYANAVYRYRHGLEKGRKWYPTAILLKIEEKYPEWTDFLTGEKFYETFARIFNAALKAGVISLNIFSEKGFNENVPSDLITDAYDKSIKILNSIKNKEISLSRKEEGIYASKSGVETYLKAFSLSPDNEKLSCITKKAGGEADFKRGVSFRSADSTETIVELQKEDTSSSSQIDSGHVLGDSIEKGGEGKESISKNGYGVVRSEKISEKLAQLNSEKLSNLYNSLCTVSLEKHPVLMNAGAWCFFEILTRTLYELENKQLTTSFDKALIGRLNKDSLYQSIEQRNAIIGILERLAKAGNITKHEKEQFLVGKQLRIDFKTLDSFIVAILELCVKAQTSRKA